MGFESQGEKRIEESVVPQESLAKKLAESVSISLEETEALVDRARTETSVNAKINILLEASRAFLAHKEPKKAQELIRQAEALYNEHKTGIESNTDRLVGNIAKAQESYRVAGVNDALNKSKLSYKLQSLPGTKINPEDMLLVDDRKDEE
jgi:hypothetical protein